MPKKVKLFDEEHEFPYRLISKQIYRCENCGFESEELEIFKHGTKTASDQGGVVSGTYEIARLECPECGEELEY